MQRFFTRFSIQGPAVSLDELLSAREARAALQRQLLAAHRLPLLCVTLVAAGGVKKSPLWDYVFAKSLEKLTALFADLGIEPSEKTIRPLNTGHEAYFVLPVDVKILKQATIALEQLLPLARLWDLDVFAADGTLLSRADFSLPPRTCLVCGGEAKTCARGRRHALDDVTAAAQRLAQQHAFAENIAKAAYQSLLEEARLTPKPGLVDAANNGSHKDMTLQTFEQSAVALRPFFTDFVLSGMQTAALPATDALPPLRAVGRRAEQAMLAATGGVNTHKGAVFSFGLVCGAVGRLYALDRPHCLHLSAICRTVADISRDLPSELADYPPHLPLTAGVQQYRRFGLTGARGEAAGGFRQIQALLPILDGYAAFDREHQCLLALLHLMAENADTNVIHRGGMDGLAFIRQTAQHLLADPARVADKTALVQALTQFDTACIDRNLSSGGSADLLALTIFFTHLRGN